jgi:hypothetical protein
VGSEWIAGLPNLKGHDGAWTAQCPAHEDSRNSLSIGVGDAGYLLKCHAGCATPAILDALGLTWRDLRLNGHAPDARTPLAVYDYHDAAGTLVYQVVRFPPKDFRQRRPDGAGGWIWSLKGVPRVLYRLPQLQGRDAVWIVEGEKDADALWRHGLAATTKAGGASGWLPTLTAQLVAAGVKTVYIVPDQDAPGQTYARQVLAACAAGGLHARVIALPDVGRPGGDVSDFLATRPIGDLLALTAVGTPPAVEATPTDPVSRLNASHAVVRENGTTLIVTFRPEGDRTVVERSTPADLHLWYANDLVPDDGKLRKASEVWIKSADRRSHAWMAFRPDLAPGRQPDGGWNLFQGFAVTPDAHQSCAVWADHVRTVIANGDEATYEAISDYVAALLQRPALPPQLCLVLLGRPGTGKSHFARVLGRFAPAHYVHLTNGNALSSKFNGWAEDCLVCTADEAIFAGDRAAASFLKALVTEPDLVIERKGRDVYRAENRVHLTICTNNPHAAPTYEGDRRNLIVPVGDGHREDHAYFERLNTHLRAGGLAGWMAALLARTIPPRLQLRTGAVLNAARLQQQVLSMTAIERWWHDRLMAGRLSKTVGWPDRVPCTELHEQYLADMRIADERRRAGETELGMFLSRVLPALSKLRLQTGGVRQYHWAWPSLTAAREAWADRLGTAVAWPDEDTLPDDLLL